MPDVRAKMHQIQLGDLGERCKVPQQGLGRSPSRNRFLVHFSHKIRHLVAKILMIFLKILERRLCQRVHSAVCTRPAANRTRLAGHEKPLFRPCAQPSASKGVSS